MQTVPFKTEIPTVEELIAESVRLNARPWREVRANYAGHPTMDGEGAQGAQGAQGGNGEGAQGAQGAQGDPDAGGGGAGGDTLTVSKSEWDNVQRQARENREKAERMEREEAERQRKADEEAGNHKAIAEREKERADAAEKRARELEETQTNEARERRVERIARKLKFKDPTDVLHHVPVDSRDEDSKVEKRLREVAKEKDYLVEGGGRANTRDVTGDETGDDAKVAGPERLSKAYASQST